MEAYRWNPDTEQWEYLDITGSGWEASSVLAGRAERDGHEYLARRAPWATVHEYEAAT